MITVCLMDHEIMLTMKSMNGIIISSHTSLITIIKLYQARAQRITILIVGVWSLYLLRTLKYSWSWRKWMGKIKHLTFHLKTKVKKSLSHRLENFLSNVMSINSVYYTVHEIDSDNTNIILGINIQSLTLLVIDTYSFIPVNVFTMKWNNQK